MDMLKYEIKKLFFNKIALALIVIFALIPAICNCIKEVDYIRNVTSINDLYELENKYEGKINDKYFIENPEVLQKIKNKMQFQISDKDEQFYFDYNNAINNFNNYNGNTNSKFDSILSLKNELEDLKNKGQEKSYYYRTVDKKYNMMLETKEPQFYFAKGWNDLLNQLSKTSNIFIGMICIVIVSSIFSNEYSSGMDSLIFSSKNGRVKIVKAKLGATIIFSITIVLFYNLIQFLSVILPTTIIGWNTPIQSQVDFMYSPYKFTMLQYFGVTVLFQVIGTIALSFIVTFMSSLFKSSLATFFTSFCIYVLPFIFILLGLHRVRGISLVSDLSVIKLIGTYDVFKQYISYNILNIPILYPYIIVVTNLIVAIIFAILTKYSVARKNAS